MNGISLDYLFIREEYRNRGYGSKILKEFINILNNNISFIVLECKIDLVKWYNKFGFNDSLLKKLKCPDKYGDELEYYFMYLSFDNDINYKKLKLIRKYFNDEIYIPYKFNVIPNWA